MSMLPYRLSEDDPALADVLALIRDSFTFMERQIDPPSSAGRLSLTDLARTARVGEVWCLGQPPHACVALHLRPETLYLGKLAVRADQRGHGAARCLVDHAVARARHHGRAFVELEVRVELTENQAAFTCMGFSEWARTSHQGYEVPTSITMRRSV